jgi:hypothetical protein
MKKLMLTLALITSLGASPAWALDPPAGSYDPPAHGDVGDYPQPPPGCFIAMGRVFCLDMPME